LSLSELGISDGDEVGVISMQLPEAEFKAQYQGNGCKGDGPYRAGFNYTANVSASFDGRGRCLLSVDEDSCMFGENGEEYECVVSLLGNGKLKLRAVCERTWGPLQHTDETWHEDTDKCFSAVMSPGRDYIILDLSVLDSFGHECRLDYVAASNSDIAARAYRSKL